MPTKHKQAKSARKPNIVAQGAKFGVVGVSNTLIDFTLFQVISTMLHVPLNMVYIVKFFSGSVAMLNSFYWNRRWTFKSRAKLGESGIKFLVSTLVSIWAIQPGMVYLFTNPWRGFSTFWYNLAVSLHIVALAPHTLTLAFVVKTVAFGMGVLGSAVWNFTLYKLWAFKEN